MRILTDASRPCTWRACIWRPRRLLAQLFRSTSGVSAAEFAIMSPVLVLACFGMVDIGMAVYERMMINQVLRAGAQPAFQGMNDSVVLTVLQETAAENFTVAEGEATGDELEVGVNSYCACPGDVAVGVGCGSTCESGSVAFRLFRLTASKAYEGVILPEFTLSGSLEVMQQ
jgi:pilus assembly protein CpaE